MIYRNLVLVVASTILSLIVIPPIAAAVLGPVKTCSLRDGLAMDPIPLASPVQVTQTTPATCDPACPTYQVCSSIAVTGWIVCQRPGDTACKFCARLRISSLDTTTGLWVPLSYTNYTGGGEGNINCDAGESMSSSGSAFEKCFSKGVTYKVELVVWDVPCDQVTLSNPTNPVPTLELGTAAQWTP